MSGDRASDSGMPHRVLLAECEARPWRNGGGVTRELLVWPATDRDPATAPASDDWVVRVSVADIDRDGPFSSFPGIDRCFAVLQGAGVELGLPAGVQSIRPGDDPVAFPGEPPTACRLLDGPTRDLNLMGRRSSGRIDMRRAHPGDRIDGRARWQALFSFDHARIDLGDGRGAQTLRPGTLVWQASPSAPSDSFAGSHGSAPATKTWQLEQAANAFWLMLDAPSSRAPGSSDGNES